jgi:5-methylcytosine-specific restriction enzyme A
MSFILCRVVWAETYNNRNETIYAAKMSNPRLHSYANERLNFANEDGHAYGFVERNESRIALEKLGASKNDSQIEGVTVIWFASPPVDNRPRIVGWYENATAYRDAQTPTSSPPRRGWQYSFKTSYNDAHLVPVTQRFSLEVPAKTRRTDKGFIGERFWFYPELSANYAKFLETFQLTMRGGTPSPVVRTPEEQAAYQEGERYKAEIMVSARNQKVTAAAKAKWNYNCQACGFNFEKIYGKIGEGFAEAHHKITINTGVRETTVNDIDVLCANCHRMVHKETPPIPIKHLREIIQARKK